ncbi:hypothetical protein HD597_009661 [Nonomuraea thailandensis]|uniref:Uncharacterized protein n=1 Tax=Nonomuraea thailandensis TaxID=1188745 RepID=A0A9X2GVS7_9ACTN|nr:hypothetical protein [Nonomuraea thailandensis]MCP2362641.1 hypothetical protein [Nonomuraea thailandensis]
MDPLRFTPGQWRALRYLATYSASAARVGFRASQIWERTGVTGDELVELAGLGHVAGRLHGSTTPPTPGIAITARGNPKLRIHLTKPGKKAAHEIAPAWRVVELLRDRHPLTADDVENDAGVPSDTLTRLDTLGFLHRELNEAEQVLFSLTQKGRQYAEPHSA